MLRKGADMKKLNRVYMKIKRDRKAFKKDMLTASAEGVYASAYEICTVEEIYNLLMNAYEYSEDDVKNILRYKGNVLKTVYQKWLESDYNYHDMLEYVIDDAMLDIEAGNKLRRLRRTAYAKAA